MLTPLSAPSWVNVIALVECWFGPFSPWFDYYLKTCEENPDVTWLIFHDAPAPPRRPRNVQFYRITRSELEGRATALLKFPVSLSSGLKICDLRPCFGALFAEQLKPHKFWGYNDSDLFWGRITHFITPELIDKYDVITGCRTSICGQFTIFRNAGVTKDVYQVIPGYERALQVPELQYLDEGKLDNALCVHGAKIYRRQLQVHDEGAVEWEEKARELELREKGHLNDWFWEGGPCRWECGRLIHIASGKEAMFVHFKRWKTEWRKRDAIPRLRYWDARMNGFEVYETGIRPMFISRSPAFRALYFACISMPHAFGKWTRRAGKFSGKIVRGAQRRLKI